MKSVIKRVLRLLAPQFAGQMQAHRDKRQIERFEGGLGLPEINKAFVDRHGLKVLGGPFAGMTYVPLSVGSAYVPKLLGSYECELHPAINTAIQEGYDGIVDVGCAEGYYAVGFARSMPGAQVFAFDTALEGRSLCAAMARGNDVEDRVTIAGTCDHAQLNALLTTGRNLVICDCEGYEYHLLRTESVPNLRRAHLLVELHPWAEPVASQAFLQEFAPTHDIHVLTSRDRCPEDFPPLAFLPKEKQQTAVNEWRPKDQQWVIMSPHLV